MKKSMRIFAIVLFSCALLCTTSAKVSKNTSTMDTGIDGLECTVEETECSSGEWLHSNTMFHFRTTNGRGATVRMNESASTFENCKPIYTSVYASKDGSWSGSGLSIEANSNEEAWSYDLHYNVEWR